MTSGLRFVAGKVKQVTPTHAAAVGEQKLILLVCQPLANFRCHPDNMSITCQLPYNTFRVSWIPALWRRLVLSLDPITAPARSEPP